MRFGSVCSGIEAASVAWNPLGWEAAWFSEIEPFPCALLAHRYPSVRNVGDMRDLPALIEVGMVEAPELLAGGTPCQAFSVAGLRRSLDDDRGNLSLVFCQIADAIDASRRARGEEPCIVFWENVPGVLSTKDNAFGCFLAGLAGESEPLVPSGRKWTHAGYVLGPTRAIAWRTLDAQYFGLAQRRKRVFVVASARDGFDPASVLFEREGVRRDSPPVRGEREEVARGAAQGVGVSGESLIDGLRERERDHCRRSSERSVTARTTAAVSTARMRIPAGLSRGTNAEGADGFTLTTSNLGKTVNNQTPLIAYEAD